MASKIDGTTAKPEKLLERKSIGNNKVLFNTRTYLANPGVGRTVWPYERNIVIFSQGDPANSLFYIQKGKVKITVLSKGGKER